MKYIHSSFLHCINLVFYYSAFCSFRFRVVALGGQLIDASGKNSYKFLSENTANLEPCVPVLHSTNIFSNVCTYIYHQISSNLS